MDPGTSRALDPGAIAGHLVYVDARDLACLRPYTNVVRDMQSAGALGVLLGNFPEDDVKTLAETAAPHDVSIPTFVLPRSSGAAIRDALLAGAGPVSVTTPRIEDGEATASDDLGVSEGVLRGRGYGWGEKKKRVDGTAVAAFFVVLAFAGVAGAAVARYRRRPEGGPDGGGGGDGDGAGGGLENQSCQKTTWERPHEDVHHHRRPTRRSRAAAAGILVGVQPRKKTLATHQGCCLV